MGEGLEAEESVVVARAAHADPAEGNVEVLDLHDEVVHAGRARARATQDLVDAPPSLAEDVEREGLGPGLDEGYDFLDGVVGEDRQDGAEDLLVHHGHAARHPREYGRWRVAGLDVEGPPELDLGALGPRVLDQGLVARAGRLINDPREVLGRAPGLLG